MTSNIISCNNFISKLFIKVENEIQGEKHMKKREKKRLNM